MKALCVPGIWAAWIQGVTIFAQVGGQQVTWQPWLGTLPYGWGSSRIATVSVSAAAASVLATPLIGIPLHASFGDVPTLLLGWTISATSCLFLGAPPLMLQWLSPHIDVYIPWLPYAAVVANAVGGAISGPASYSLPIRAFVRATGETQEAAAVPISMLIVLAPYLGMSIGPSIAAWVIDRFGVPALGLVWSGTTLAMGASVLLTNWRVLTTVMEPEKGSDTA